MNNLRHSFRTLNDSARARSRLTGEGGYTLVALVALMSLLALFALAAAPRIQQQAQREREKEAIFRGEQVADAIRSYYRYRGGQGANSLPTSMDQLLEGIPRGTKKLQILRSEAAHDPLSSSGEWRQIGPTSSDFSHFLESLTVYGGGIPPVPRQEFAGLASLLPRITNAIDTETRTAPGGDRTAGDTSGPVLGVGMPSQRKSVIGYYGIQRD